MYEQKQELVTITVTFNPLDVKAVKQAKRKAKLAIAEAVAKTTPTKIDDVVVDIIRGAYQKGGLV